MSNEAMNKSEAKKAMQAGKKVTHRHFSADEWMTMENGKIVLEDGVKCHPLDFWIYRSADSWNDAYSLFEEPDTIPTPLPNDLEQAGKEQNLLTKQFMKSIKQRPDDFNEGECNANSGPTEREEEQKDMDVPLLEKEAYLKADTFKRLTAQLKDCPFCGGKPGEDLFVTRAEPDHYLVKCCFCAASMKHDRSDKVIGIWNHRGLIKNRS